MKRIATILVCLAGLWNADSANAALLLGTNINLNWDRTASPNAAPTLTLPVFNDAVGTTPDLFGYQVRLRIAPRAGATGTLEFAPSGFAAPTDGSYILSGFSGGLVITPTTNTTDVSVADAHSAFQSVSVPANGRVLANLAFVAPSNALGMFDIFAVENTANETLWTDGSFNNQAFGNIPFNGNDVLLATINIVTGSSTVVPEPSGLVVASTLALVGLIAYRRRAVRRS